MCVMHIFCCRCAMAVSNGDMMEAYACQGVVTQYPSKWCVCRGVCEWECCVCVEVCVCEGCVCVEVCV